MKKTFILALLFCMICASGPIMAQTATTDQLYKNIFAAGASYDNISKPGVTVGLLNAYLLTPPENTNPVYSFTLVDISPIKTSNGISWQTAVTTGLAPFSRSLGPLGKAWIAGTIGGGVSGNSSGLAWSSGVAVSKTITKSGLLIIVDLRVLKVAATDYQGRLGVKVGFGSK